MAEEDEKFLLDEDIECPLPESPRSSKLALGCTQPYDCHLMLHLVIAFVGSVFLNIVLAVLLLRGKAEIQAKNKWSYGQQPILRMPRMLTDVADLDFDTIGTISHLGPYGSNNRNETDRAILWENLDGSSAQIAVDKTWAADRALPPSQEFTWDQDKAVYSLRAFHSQHCLVSVTLTSRFSGSV